MMRLELDLWRIHNPDGIKVVASLIFDRPFAGELTFLLGRNLSIESIDGGQECGIEAVDEFYRQANKITVSIPNEIIKLEFCYSGRPEGWFNFLTNDVFAVNSYSAWYPDKISLGDADVLVRFHDTSFAHVVNAKYDDIGQFWQYRPKDFDCNILAFKKPKSLRDDALDLFYIDGEGAGMAAKAYFTAYMEAAEFCIDLFGSPLLEKNVLVVVPEGSGGGVGYCRKNLIVLSGFMSDISIARHIIAHEIAHFWCKGAAADTWEDWLNETTAEWAALLFEIRSGRTAIFDAAVKGKLSKNRDLPAIKTPDGSRPDGVHDKGVCLFYRVYEKYGYVAIVEMLRIFCNLSVKTTDSYILALRTKFNPDIAAMIDSGVDLV